MDEFNYTDIIWTKNVKRDDGNSWAYMDKGVGDTFKLDWSAGHNLLGETDAQKARINQLILIFQTIKNMSDFKKGTYLTHIVTPVTMEVRHRNTPYPYNRDVIVVAKNDNPIPKPKFLNFHKPNRGWLCDIGLIEPMRGYPQLSREEKQLIIWDLFVQKEAGLIQLASIPIDDNYEGSEGAESTELRRHKYYERDPRVISRKKLWAIANDQMFCEICKFGFLEKYGEHGRDFIECHHKNHISKDGQRLTRLEDLALVCSNCHRMLHRKNNQDEYYSISELAELVNVGNSPGRK